MNNKVLNFNDFLNKNNLNESLIYNHQYKNIKIINEGGAFGHLNHPFDNHDLTFGDLKEMIELTINGSFTEDNFVAEKNDGQNLMFTIIDGQLRAARNKSHLRNRGEKSLTSDEVFKMFDGRGEIQNAFSYAMTDMQNALSKISKDELESMFENGKKFMSFEVIYPKTENVIPYGLSLLIFQEVYEYDESGEPIGIDKKAGKRLGELVEEVNQQNQEHFFIRGPKYVKLEQLPDISKKEKYYFKKLNDIMKSESMRDSNTISDYLDKKWYDYITNEFESLGFEVNDEIKDKILIRVGRTRERGAFSVSAMKKEITDENVIEWIREFEKNDQKKKTKDFIKPLEYFFLELGADVLLNITNMLTANPKKGAETLKRRIQDVIKEIQSGDNEKNIEKLQVELERLEASGGLDKVVSSEGITFMFKGEMYKYTGIFAVLNQLTGILKFG